MGLIVSMQILSWDLQSWCWFSMELIVYRCRFRYGTCVVPAALGLSLTLFSEHLVVCVRQTLSLPQASIVHLLFSSLVYFSSVPIKIQLYLISCCCGTSAAASALVSRSSETNLQLSVTLLKTNRLTLTWTQTKWKAAVGSRMSRKERFRKQNQSSNESKRYPLNESVSVWLDQLTDFLFHNENSSIKKQSTPRPQESATFLIWSAI